MSDHNQTPLSEHIVTAAAPYRAGRAPATMLNDVLNQLADSPRRRGGGLLFAGGFALSLMVLMIVTLNQVPPLPMHKPQYPSLSMIKMPNRGTSTLRVPSTVSVPIKVPSVPKSPSKPKPVKKSQSINYRLDYRIVLQEQDNDENHA